MHMHMHIHIQTHTKMNHLSTERIEAEGGSSPTIFRIPAEEYGKRGGGGGRCNVINPNPIAFKGTKFKLHFLLYTSASPFVIPVCVCVCVCTFVRISTQLT